VSHDGVNATLPTDMSPDTITLEQAVGLIEARSARGGGKRPPAPRSTARKAPARAEAAAKPKPPAGADKKPRKAKAAE
jgi:DNA topoisomerase-1